MTCTFFGVHDVWQKDVVAPALRAAIADLIKNRGVTNFYVRHHGNFDNMVQGVLADFAKTHGVNCCVALSNLPQKKELCAYELPTLLPDGIENAPPRFRIEYRNRWMIAQSDFVITYCPHTFGNSAKFKAMAQRKGKTVIELAPGQADVNFSS